MGAGVRRPPARGGVPLARRLRFAHVCPRLRSPWVLPLAFTPNHARVCSQPSSPRVLPLTNPPVLTPLILGPAPKLPGCKRLHLSFSPSHRNRRPGRAKTRIPTHPFLYLTTPTKARCKRLHLTFGPSERDRSSGRTKSRILSDLRGRGCVRRASSSRPRAHRRRPRPTVWVVGCESGGLRCRQLTVTFRSKLRRALHSRVVCARLTFANTPLTLAAPTIAEFVPRCSGRNG